MKYTFLGNTGLRVSELALGTMRWGADEGTNHRILDAYTEAGGNFLDTANAYGASEAMLGKVLKGRRDGYALATKYTLTTDPNDANAEGNGRKSLVRSLDASLKRLQTDYVDLYWVHVWDGFTPVEETLEALNDAVRQGKVLYVGLSDFPAWLVARADALAELRGLTRPAAIQIKYNLAARDAEREILPMAEALGLSILDWSPLGGGALTGKYLSKERGDEDAPYSEGSAEARRRGRLPRRQVPERADEPHRPNRGGCRRGDRVQSLAARNCLAAPPLPAAHPHSRGEFTTERGGQPGCCECRDSRRGREPARLIEPHRARLSARLLPAQPRRQLVRRPSR